MTTTPVTAGPLLRARGLHVTFPGRQGAALARAPLVVVQGVGVHARVAGEQRARAVAVVQIEVHHEHVAAQSALALNP